MMHNPIAERRCGDHSLFGFGDPEGAIAARTVGASAQLFAQAQQVVLESEKEVAGRSCAAFAAHHLIRGAMEVLEAD